MSEPFRVVVEGMTLQRNDRTIDMNDDLPFNVRSYTMSIPFCHIKVTAVLVDGYVAIKAMDGPYEGWGTIIERAAISADWFIPD
jgi:hypothetical protein